MVRWSVRFLVVAAVAVVCLSSSSAFAQRGGQGGRGGAGGFGGGFGGGGNLALLQNEDVKKEIDFLPEQQEKIEAIQTKLRDEMRAQFEGFRDLSQDERTARMEKLRTEGEARTKKLTEEVNAVLLPQQVKRLNQIALQQRIQRAGTVAALTGETLGLGVTDDQKTKLEELAKAAEKELADKIAKARAEAVDKILSGLTPEQKAKAKEALGAEFKFTAPQRGPGQGGPGGNQPGGRGGNRPATNET